MKSILITSIGNRNIKVDGKLLDLKDNNGLNFKESTRKILEELDSDYPIMRRRISVEILQNVIEKVDQIILIATNQRKSDFNYQDTIFEARILKIIFEKEYGKQTIIITFEKNPADEFETYQFISHALKELRSLNLEAKYLINDAGGTPHMKQALKDLVEFYFPNNFEIVYVNQKDEIRWVNRWGGKKYIILTIISEFIRNYDYHAANFLTKNLNRDLFDNNLPRLSSDLRSYIHITSRRINFDRQGAKNQFSKEYISENLRENTLLSDYVESMSFKGFKAVPFEQINKKGRNDIFEVASICQLYFTLGNYTLAVATLYRFIEEVCQSFIESEGIYPIKRKTQRIKFIKSESKTVISKYGKVQEAEGLPFYLGYVSLKSEGPLNELLAIFRELVSHINSRRDFAIGINILRNQCYLAHNNEPITREILDRTFPNLLKGENWIARVFEICGLPEMNIYDQMNEQIIKLIHNE